MGVAIEAYRKGEKPNFSDKENRFFELAGIGPYSKVDSGERKPTAGGEPAAGVEPAIGPAETMELSDVSLTHPNDYQVAAGWFKQTKRKIRRSLNRLVQSVDTTFVGYEHPRVVERQTRIDRLDGLISNGNVTRMFISIVNGDYTIVYRGTEQHQQTGAVAVAEHSNLRHRGEFKVHYVSYLLMKNAKAALGDLESSQSNRERVRAYVFQEFKKLRSLRERSVATVRSEEVDDICKNASLMYFIPTTNDLIRSEIIAGERNYVDLVRLNDQTAPRTTQA